MWVKGDRGKSQANAKGEGERQFSNTAGGWAELGHLMLLPCSYYRRAGILTILCTGGSPSQAATQQHMLAVSALSSNA